MGSSNVEINILVNGQEQLDTTTHKFKKFGDEVDKTSTKANHLKQKMTQLDGRFITHAVSVTALTMKMIQFGKSSIEAAQKSERLREELEQSNRILNDFSKSWNTFKEDLGAGLIQMGAGIIAMGEFAGATQKATIELQKHVEWQRANVFERQRMIEKERDLILATAEGNRMLEANNALMEKYNQVIIGSYSSLDSLKTALEATGISQELINVAVQKWIDLQVIINKPDYEDAFMRKSKATKGTKEEVEKLLEALEKLKQQEIDMLAQSSSSGAYGKTGMDLSHSSNLTQEQLQKLKDNLSGKNRKNNNAASSTGAQ